jgi:uncharacterized Zn finger protein (UPF0148 family)
MTADLPTTPPADEALEGQIALTLQENGCYPYPQFVKPLVALFKSHAEQQPQPISMINGIDCPACGHPTLYLGNGGHITCAVDDCPNPDYADALKSHAEQEKAAAVLEARIDEAQKRYDSAKRLLERSRKWQLTEAGRHDMIMGEELLPAEARLKQLRGEL